MSCIAKFYVFPLSKCDAFFQAKAKESRKRVEVRRRLLFFSRQLQVPEEPLWAWMDRESSVRCNFPFSGFLISDYLFTLYAEPCAGYFQTVDDYASLLSAENSKLLSDFLSSHLPERHALEGFLRQDRKKEPDTEIVDAFISLHAILLEWCYLVKPNSFGVLYLSF